MNQGQPFYVDLPITLGVNVLHEHRKSNGRKVANPFFNPMDDCSADALRYIVFMKARWCDA